MKAWEFDAVIYNGAVYCIECLPAGIDVDNDEVLPIFASDEWQTPGPCCDTCGTLHEYMGLIE